jgi:tetratricopeptide (TPR) repeat protein
VARGTQHRKSRPRANAGVAEAAPKKASKPKVQHAAWEDQLFFSRLRTHTKWVFGFLAVVFALSFVFLGVGSGSSGISDVLGNFFNTSSGSGPSVSSAQDKTRDRPNDPQAWRELATVLVQNDRADEAVAALQRYAALKPKDPGALQELGSLHLIRAEGFAQDYVDAQNTRETLTPSAMFAPTSSSPFAKAFEDPLSSAITVAASTATADAYSKYIGAQTDAVAVYKRLVALNPKDATNQFRLAQVAQTAGDTPTAVAGYQKFLALSPNDSLAPRAKQALKQLTGSATPSATAG